MKCGKLGKSQFDADTYVWPSDEKSSHICVLDNKKPIQRSTIVHFSNHEGANTRLNFLFENFNQNWSSSISANLFSVSSVIHPKPSVFPPSRLPTLTKLSIKGLASFERNYFYTAKTDLTYRDLPLKSQKGATNLRHLVVYHFIFLRDRRKICWKTSLMRRFACYLLSSEVSLFCFFLKLSQWIHYTPRIVKSYDPIIIS